jgi:hypothetical protein
MSACPVLVACGFALSAALGVAVPPASAQAAAAPADAGPTAAALVPTKPTPAQCRSGASLRAVKPQSVDGSKNLVTWQKGSRAGFKVTVSKGCGGTLTLHKGTKTLDTVKVTGTGAKVFLPERLLASTGTFKVKVRYTAAGSSRATGANLTVKVVKAG